VSSGGGGTKACGGKSLEKGGGVGAQPRCVFGGRRGPGGEVDGGARSARVLCEIGEERGGPVRSGPA
jgi:hypothetical protein